MKKRVFAMMFVPTISFAQPSEDIATSERYVKFGKPLADYLLTQDGCEASISDAFGSYEETYKGDLAFLGSIEVMRGYDLLGFAKPANSNDAREERMSLKNWKGCN